MDHTPKLCPPSFREIECLLPTGTFGRNWACVIPASSSASLFLGANFLRKHFSILPLLLQSHQLTSSRISTLGFMAQYWEALGSQLVCRYPVFHLMEDIINQEALSRSYLLVHPSFTLYHFPLCHKGIAVIPSPLKVSGQGTLPIELSQHNR